MDSRLDLSGRVGAMLNCVKAMVVVLGNVSGMARTMSYGRMRVTTSRYCQEVCENNEHEGMRDEGRGMMEKSRTRIIYRYLYQNHWIELPSS